MPKKISIFLILIISFGLLIFNLFGTEKVEASSADNVWGWAWGGFPELEGGVLKAGSGWVKFNNCTDPANPATCEPIDYGVNIDPVTFDLSDFAWLGGGEDAFATPASTLGWIKFGEPLKVAAESYPVCPPSTCPGGSPDYAARYDPATEKFTGWARVCSGTVNGDCDSATRTDGWDGWVLLGPIVKGGTDYGVSLNTLSDPDEFEGWAWGGDVVGWISFNCANQGVCGSSDYKVMTNLSVAPPNNPPDQPTSAGITWGLECERTMAVPTFNWNYSDPDDVPPGTDPQTDCQIRVAPNPADFQINPISGDPIIDIDEFTCSGSICSGGSFPSFALPDGEWISWALFDTTYYWTVRVKDSNNNWSDWMTPDPFTTPLHTYPEPDFAHSPAMPVIGEVVTFTDNSTCYDAANNPYPCKNNPANQYQWDFEDDGSIDSNYRGDVTSTHAAAGDYTVRLYVTDDLGTCDTTGSTPITTTLPLPEYREVAPTARLDDFLARLNNIFGRL